MNSNTVRFSLIAKLVSTVSLVVASSSVFATATWTFGNSPCQPTITSCTATSPDEATPAKITLASAYANTGSGAVFAAAALTDQDSNGLGVSATSDAAGSPYHAMDNNGNTEFILLKFDKDIILDKVKIGWISGDSDISLLRWTGASNALNATVTGTLAKTVGSLTSVANTWSLVGHYDGATLATATTTSDTDIIIDVNATGQTSSWWIISAYNSGYGGTALSNSGFADYMKVLAVVSQNPSSSGGRVPEPASLALMGVALAGLMTTRRKVKTAV